MSGFEILITVLLILVILSIAVLALVFGSRFTRIEQEKQTATLMQKQVTDLIGLQDNRLSTLGEHLSKSLTNFNNTLSQRFTENQQLAQTGQKSVAERLEATGQTIADVRNQLGQLSEAAKQISQIGADMRKLQDILQSPKLRGSLGEWSLENLLSEVLPKAHYQLQYNFINGVKVDAIVKLIDGMVCIDAKFPLPNFLVMLEATNEADQQRARKAFYRDVKNRIDEIASRYILPDQGTLDFALMYIPAENVYYEIITASTDTDLNAYARSRKVIPVSPNTLYAYLMMIATGLKGMQLEKNARLIQNRIADLRQQMTLFTGDIGIIGKHLNNASIKFSESQRKLDQINNTLEQIDLDSENSVD